MKKVLKDNRKTILSALIYVAILVAILFAFRIDADSYIYVDDSAKGEMNGSSKHPYDDIQDGIDKAKKKDKDVKVRKGTYKENIKIWKDVEVVGSDKDEVKIIGKNDSKPTVEMYDDTAIRKVTIQEGKEGIRVREGARATINGVQIFKAEDDGIKAKEAKTTRKKELVVINSLIQSNGRAGIYAESRKVKIEDNTILDNDSDGVDLERGSEGKVEDNDIKNNEGVGIKVGIDGSEIYIKKNTIRNNDRDGIEVKTKGRLGFVQIERNKLYKNERWGIARVARQPFSADAWHRSLKIFGDNIYWDNRLGEVSPIINLY